MGMTARREEALIAGQRFYKELKPCRRGHDCMRYTSTGNCVECAVRHSKTQQIKVDDAKRLNNARKWNDPNSFVCTVPNKWTNIFRMLEEIMLNRGDGAQATVIRAIMDAHDMPPVSQVGQMVILRPANTLVRDEILQTLIYVNGVVTNYTEQELRDYEHGVAIKLKDGWYDGNTVMKVLREQCDYVDQIKGMY